MRELRLDRKLPLIVAATLSVAACTPRAAVPGPDQPFTAGYHALASGRYAAARPPLEAAYEERSADPYKQLALAATYQNNGEVYYAIPLYKFVETNGTTVFPGEVTLPQDKGKSLAQIAAEDCVKAGLSPTCDPAKGREVSETTTTTVRRVPAYQIYFNFDRADLTPAAREIVATAAAAARSAAFTRILVTGHTDTVGTRSYNLGLSRRRAVAVQRALEADGIPGAEIVATGVGREGLLVPTADGVREPQNRRVEIDAGEAATQ